MNRLLLKKLLEQTPRMEPQDAVKLAYQSAFGCGHLLPAQDRCAQRIEAEMQAVSERDMPVSTPIGNGLCRLNLSSPAVRALESTLIARMMAITDEIIRERKDNDRRCREILDLLSAMSAQGEAPFSHNAFQNYLIGYDGSVVSHTPLYRELYQPAYRVVLEDLALLVPALACKHPLIVLDGPCGSGKSTLGRLLGRLLDTQPIPMDDFFLPLEMRTAERLAEPGGNVHRERFASEVLAQLPGDVHWKRFDCGSFQLMDRFAKASPIMVIEGSYSHHPAFSKRYEELGALRVYIDVDEAEQLCRIRKRDPELLEMFQTRWIPLEKTYFEAYDIKGRAEVIIHSPSNASGEERDE